MLTLHDYFPSQNAWKVNHLGIEYRTVPVCIFEGEGKRPEFLAKNPAGADGIPLSHRCAFQQ